MGPLLSAKAPSAGVFKFNYMGLGAPFAGGKGPLDDVKSPIYCPSTHPPCPRAYLSCPTNMPQYQGKWAKYGANRAVFS